MSNFYGATSLIGGGSKALDSLDGADLVDGDGAIVIIDSISYIYHLDATSGIAESSPNVIIPDNNPGTKRWILTYAGSGCSSRCSAYLGNAQTISNITWTPVAFDTKNWDNDDEFDIVINKGRFTAKTKGYYHISAIGNISAVGAGKYAYFHIWKNGSDWITLNQKVAFGTESFYMQGSADVYLNGSTDYVEIRVYHNKGSDATLYSDRKNTSVSIHRFA